MSGRELEVNVLRGVREIGIAPEARVRAVSIDLGRGVVAISSDEATHVAPAGGLWSDYVDDVARTRPHHARLIQNPEGGTESTADAW